MTEPQLMAAYWGKANPSVPSEAGHHTVLAHSLDVAACAFTLLQKHEVVRTQIVDDSGLAPDTIAITIAAICALHDIGKLDTRFQRKAPAIADLLRPESATTATMPYDHGAEGFRQLEADESALDSFDTLVGLPALPLLRAVCGHHGTLPVSAEPAPSRQSIAPELRRADARARESFVEIIANFFTGRGAVLPWRSVVEGPLVQRVAGLCAVADWVGSDVEHFPYAAGPVDLESYWSSACTRAGAACEAAGLVRVPIRRLGFSELFPGYEPRDVQTITEPILLDEPALIVIEAEMGKGKTEAALSMASRLLQKGMGDGVTVALPTMATSNAMFARVTAVASRLFEAGSQVHLALAHGKASRHPGFRRLAERSLQAIDQDATEASVACARWLLNKKRILLAQLGVGTIDQALQAALVVRHQFVRMFGLSRNVVIIDEVHAYDAYMEVLLDHLLRWLGALRVPVILLSATLPSERRAALARAWTGEEASEGQLVDDESTARARPYPLVSVTTRRETTLHADSVGACTGSREILLESSCREDDDEQHVVRVASRLLAAAASGARVVWIRNTVREAQRAFRAIDRERGDLSATLFHSRFRGCDRSIIEQDVLERFGKEARGGGRVLVATQVVEQSLDLDFDEMHSDLAPIDLLLQRIGRLHRHERGRPEGFGQPRLIVHVPPAEAVAKLDFGPSQYVYDTGTLWIANHLLLARDHIALPKDIRPLVEATYHSAARAELLATAGPRLLEQEAALGDKLRGRRANAKRCCIPPTSVDVDGQVALDDDDDAVQAFTRDGRSATILPLAWDGAAARALFDPPTARPWDLDPSAPAAWRLASAILDQTLSIPSQVEVAGLPSAGDIEPWDAWMRRFRRFADRSGLGTRIVPLPMVAVGGRYEAVLRSGTRMQAARYTIALGLEIDRSRSKDGDQ